MSEKDQQVIEVIRVACEKYFHTRIDRLGRVYAIQKKEGGVVLPPADYEKNRDSDFLAAIEKALQSRNQANPA